MSIILIIDVILILLTVTLYFTYLLLQEVDGNAPKRSRLEVFRVHVLVGGESVSNRQIEPFVKALNKHNFNKLGVKVETEYMSNMDIRDNTKWSTYTQIVDWLLDSDAYFILCHPHQGFLGWRIPIASLEAELQRCNEHGNGCPIGGQLSDAVFRQDKFDYLKIIPEHVNPTLRIDIKEVYNSEEMKQIGAFFQLRCPNGGCLKAPHTTGGNWIRYPKRLHRPDDFKGVDPLALYSYLKSAFTEFHGIFDYVMLQPCIDLGMKREYKVVFIRGKASHICSYSKGLNHKMFAEDTDVLKFAQQAFDDYRSRVGEANSWLDQLIRCDIMWNDIKKRMVVNEIETIEADYKMKEDCYQHLDNEVLEFLTEYLYKKLDDFVVKKIAAMY